MNPSAVMEKQEIRPLLPVRPRPMEGEATIGFLARVAEANGFESPRQLWLVLMTTERLFEALRLTENERHHLFGLFPGHWGKYAEGYRLAIPDFNHTQLRWCPLCLMESNYLRGIWLIKLYSVCTRNGIHLHDQCPSCGSVQRLEHPNIDMCGCGAKRVTGTVKKADTSLVQVTQALEASIKGQTINSGLPSLTAPEWIRLATYLGQFSESYQPTRPGKVSGLHQLDTATGLMSGLARLLDNWPRNFHKLLRAIDRQGNSSLSLQRTFGSLYRVLYRQFKEPEFQFLRDAFEDYVHQHWDGIICKRNKSFKASTICTHPQLSLKQAAKQAGTVPATVKHLIQAEHIASAESKTPSGRKTRTVNQHQLPRITALTRNNVTLQDVAKLLGLPKQRVRVLVDSGIITPLITLQRTKAAAWLIPMQQVKKLWFRPNRSDGTVSLVPFSKILQNWKLQKDELVALVHAISTNEIEPLSENSQPTPIGKLRLDASEFQQWINARRIASFGTMSVDGAAKVLGLKQQVAYELVRNGMLKATYDNQKGMRVSEDSIRLFKENYVTLAELARSSGSSPRKLLKETDAQPVCGPSVDGSRQYFFRRNVKA